MYVIEEYFASGRAWVALAGPLAYDAAEQVRAALMARHPSNYRIRQWVPGE